jgi:hypothetical protein
MLIVLVAGARQPVSFCSLLDESRQSKTRFGHTERNSESLPVWVSLRRLGGVGPGWLGIAKSQGRDGFPHRFPAVVMSCSWLMINPADGEQIQLRV